VSGQFRERKVLYAYLQPGRLDWEERWGWDKDFVRDGREYVGNFVLREADMILSE
jgi:hypothetical protein